MEIYTLVFSPIEVNTYIIADSEGNCAVLDCGTYDDQEFSELVSFIDSKNLKPLLLLNTHCHLDHVFGNGRFMKRYGLSPASSEQEEPNRKNSPSHAIMFGLFMDEPPAPDHYVKHNDLITFGSIMLKALHVPGHTAGSMAYWSESDSCVFTGDALFAGSIGRTDLPGGDYQTLINSLRQNLLVLPAETKVYPGHGPATTIGTEAATNPYLR